MIETDNKGIIYSHACTFNFTGSDRVYIAEHTLTCDNHHYIQMGDSLVKLNSKRSGSIGENHVQVQKKKEETLRSGIHSYVHGRVRECVCVSV